MTLEHDVFPDYTTPRAMGNRIRDYLLQNTASKAFITYLRHFRSAIFSGYTFLNTLHRKTINVSPLVNVPCIEASSTNN